MVNMTKRDYESYLESHGVRLLRNRRIAYITLGFAALVVIATMTILLYNH